MRIKIMAKRFNLIEIGTPVRVTYRWGQVVEGKVIAAEHAGGRIKYQVLDNKDGLSIWEGNSRAVKPIKVQEDVQ